MRGYFGAKNPDGRRGEVGLSLDPAYWAERTGDRITSRRKPLRRPVEGNPDELSAKAAIRVLHNWQHRRAHLRRAHRVPEAELIEQLFRGNYALVFEMLERNQQLILQLMKRLNAPRREKSRGRRPSSQLGDPPYYLSALAKKRAQEAEFKTVTVIPMKETPRRMRPRQEDEHAEHQRKRAVAG
jgi:hypothetical protein